MSFVFLRRRSRILLLIGIAGFLFLCFQLFSFKVINISNRMEHESQRQARVLDDRLEIEFDQENHMADSKSVLDKSNELKFDGKDLQSDKHVVDSKHKVDKSNDLKTQKKVWNRDQRKSEDKSQLVDMKIAEKSKKSEKYQYVRGTHLHQAEDYREKDGMFQCIITKEMIPFSQVNDDYCDCDDSTDEPGTAACPDSVFYCAFQNSEQPPQQILGSRVNDGVCDCCDGSDEWAGTQVYGGVHVKGKVYKNSLSHSPCNNTCKAVQQNLEEDARIRELGKRLKQTYLESGKKVKETNAYGPDGVFYQLSLTCFDHETKEYKYTFCPFKSVTQQSFPKAAIFIGKKPVWRTRLKGVYVLKMEGGDTSACPGGKQRQTVITFICGLSDHIIEISEDEKCVYGMKFSTPAAC